MNAGGSVFFERIAIIGVGLIGGSMGLALRRTGFEGRLVGVSRKETVERAMELGVIDEGWTYDELDRALEGADLVVVCTPIKRILELLEQIPRSAAPGTLVTDVGSTKRRIVECAARHFGDEIHFLGGHPMAGSEKAGVDAADPFLFQNAIYILVQGARIPPELLDRFTQLLQQIGAKVVELPAELHDQVVAAISHLPQMMATALVEMVGRKNEEQSCFLPLAAGGFRDLTRIASSPYAPVWEDICQTNADEIGVMIDEYVTILEDFRSRLGEESLGRDFSFANRIRDSIPRDAKGFIHQLFEILVQAEDKPGILAEIATAMKEEGININDIEIVKVREGEGGTIRLGFDADEAALRALEVLHGLGYQARRP